MEALNKIFIIFLLVALGTACKAPQYAVKTRSQDLPKQFASSTDTNSLAKISWKDYFQDPNLIALIDTALQNNQEMNILEQEIAISQNEIRARRGEYLPFVTLNGGAGADRVGRFTRFGALEESTEIEPGKAFPKVFSDFVVGFSASWELDVWKRLRNAKKAAVARYMASKEGKNFFITQLVAEIASSYYELLALDNLLEIVKQNIEIQRNALEIIKQEKNSAKVSQLAVNRFEAQLLNTTNLQYEIKQKITETENRLHLLTGGFPKEIRRNSDAFHSVGVDSLRLGIPSQLFRNRPDIRQAEWELQAAKLDIASARAAFNPAFRLNGFAGVQAFQPHLLFNPESLIFSLMGDMVAPIINRNALQANYYSAHHRQAQTLYRYQQRVLVAYLEVQTQWAAVKNYSQSYQTKSKEAEILSKSVDISSELYKYARADYMEVLLTQREALNVKMELTEIKLRQLLAKVNIYRALGGGW
ncbi:TolC family protein [Raineya orbicola]|jgi:NodT family efflux transporter outer membrane factor (OMF) lipoprotein|uniref:Efflux transporter, outer membrane factor (OMF) lipoprotein, NodT family n=1 Tax=Raineya orbicola TaxID=2016530 RepID=A0A2N3IKD4_9BACT|nr:efflux transporter outer membrane subunit [Raineya orbicola]PKQ70708.1 Efflux transporter, outer membrane factor (OMF) lipoprotein, NodT family [Raineya orbicola]